MVMCDPANPSANSLVNTRCTDNTPERNITLDSIMELIIQERELRTENILRKGFDEMIFYYFVHHLKQNHKKPELSVFRRNSSNLPKLTDDYIDWEETVYLNLLMQYFVYVVTVAVCTRTGPQEWQILKKFSQTVYASPSHRQMNVKGSNEEIVYPDLYFTIDNYEEAFAECVLRDSESISVELTAYDRSGRVHGVCFIGTISYNAIKQFYDYSSQTSRSFGGNVVNHHSGYRQNRSTTTSTTNTAHSSSSPPNIDNTPTQFMRVIGPQAKGSAEIAIKSMKNITHRKSLDSSKTDDMKRTNFITKCCQPICPVESNMEYNSTDDWMFYKMDWTHKTVHSEVITQQPIITCKSTSIDYYEFPPETCLNGTNPNNKKLDYLQNILTDTIPTLRPSPWSVKSAGASLHTSPVRRFKYSVGSKCSTPRIGLQEFSPTLNHKCKFNSVNTINLYQESKPSKVSEILSAFTGIMTKQSLGNVNRTKSTSTNPMNCTNKSIHKNSTNIIMSLPTMCDDDHSNNDQFRNFDFYKGHLYENPFTISDRNNSFGQAWSWFKEKRRTASVGLITSPTFITLPCQNILVELLEVRREPILNFTSQ
ncbi:unnamed protein product [Schistosoma turkestanicum]|nr:unnamed protein product [Schistosoma turkestanicum]